MQLSDLVRLRRKIEYSTKDQGFLGMFKLLIAGSAVLFVRVKEPFIWCLESCCDLRFPTIAFICLLLAYEFQKFSLPDFESIDALPASFCFLFFVGKLYFMRCCSDSVQSSIHHYFCQQCTLVGTAIFYYHSTIRATEAPSKVIKISNVNFP